MRDFLNSSVEVITVIVLVLVVFLAGSNLHKFFEKESQQVVTEKCYHVEQLGSGWVKQTVGVCP